MQREKLFTFSLVIYLTSTLLAIFLLIFLCEDFIDNIDENFAYFIFLLLAAYFFIICPINPGVVSLSENNTNESFMSKNTSPSKVDDNYFSFDQNLEGENSLPPKHFCDKCIHVQEYRTKHCKTCDLCIYKYDHHCFLIGS